MGNKVSDFTGFRGYQVKGSDGDLTPDAEIYKDGRRIAWDDPALDKARTDFEGDWALLGRDNELLKRSESKHPPLAELQALAKRAKDFLSRDDLSPRMRSSALLHLAAADGMIADGAPLLEKATWGKQAIIAVREAMAADPSNFAAFKSFAETLLGIDKGTHSGWARVGQTFGQNVEKNTCAELGIDLDREIAWTIQKLRDGFFLPEAGDARRSLMELQTRRAQRH